MLTENARTVLSARYLLKDQDGKVVETPEQLFARVAKAIADAELIHDPKTKDTDAWQEKFYNVMASLRFLPNSPTLMNAGTGNRGTLSGCFVLPIDDTMSSILEPDKFGIMEAVRAAALVQKSGGGCGFSFSRLRATGMHIKSTHGKACGPLGVLYELNQTAELVTQGGKRKGANMGLIRVDHPNVGEFAHAKEKHGTLSNFNLSIAITDEFMQCVADGLEFALKDPNTGKKVKSIDAKAFYSDIVRLMHANGEPGVVFIDAINRGNPTPHLGEIEGTNPCLHGDSYLLTNEGLQRVRQLAGKAIALWDGVSWVRGCVVRTGVKPLKILRLSNGMTLKATDDHMISTEASDLSGESLVDIELRNLKPGESVELPRNLPDSWGTPRQAWPFVIFGFMQGDGTYHKASGRWKYANIGQKDLDVKKFFNDNKFPLSPVTGSKHKFSISAENARSIGFWLNPMPLPLRTLTDEIMSEGPKQIAAFLRGLYSANGSVLSAGRVTLKSTCREMIGQVQILLSVLGVRSYITTNKAKAVGFDNGTFLCKESYDLNITSSELEIFRNKVGFIQQYKNTKLSEVVNYQKIGRRLPVTVVSVEDFNEADDVFDFVSPDTHHGIVNGLLIHNCGEQPLLPFESCNLGSINLAAHVEDGEICWNDLADTVRVAVRFLDNVIDINVFPLEEIDKVTRQTRKIGLGVMGFADMLSLIGVPYNSAKGVKTGREIMRFIQKEAVTISEALADEKGPFPAYKKNAIVTKPRRNATLTTIAPTGSLSKIADCSAGVEPHFGLAYEAHILDGKILKFVTPSLLQVFPVTDGIMEKILKEGGSVQGIREIPGKIQKAFPCAHEIGPEWHIKMQAAFQEYCDNAVSKTINLPNSTTVEQMRDIISMAFTEGCKGLTVYRMGSRPEQVIVLPNGQLGLPEDLHVKPRRRPKETIGRTKVFNVGECGDLYVTVNRDKDTGEIVEIFAQPSGGESGCQSLVNALGKVTSLMLRTGVDPEYVANKLKGQYCHACGPTSGTEVRSCPEAFYRALPLSTMGILKNTRFQLRDFCGNELCGGG